MGVRNSRELETLALVLDKLLDGDAVGGMDVLSQRFKAIEHVLNAGSWNTASHLELIEMDEGLASLEERQLLQKREMLMHKLEEARRKSANRG